MCDSVVKCEWLNRTNGCVTRGGSLSVSAKTAKITTGNGNTAIGFSALFNNTVGDSNTAIGSQALLNNMTGSANIALGVNAGINLTTGDNNIDIANPGVPGESDTIRIGRQGIETRT